MTDQDEAARSAAEGWREKQREKLGLRGREGGRPGNGMHDTCPPWRLSREDSRYWGGCAGETAGTGGRGALVEAMRYTHIWSYDHALYPYMLIWDSGVNLGSESQTH